MIKNIYTIDLTDVSRNPQKMLYNRVHKYCTDYNPEAKDILYDDATEHKYVNIFMEYYIKKILDTSGIYTYEKLNLTYVEEHAFREYLKINYTEEQLRTVNVDNTEVLKSMKEVLLKISLDQLNHRDSKLSKLLFTKKPNYSGTRHYQENIKIPQEEFILKVKESGYGVRAHNNYYNENGFAKNSKFGKNYFFNISTQDGSNFISNFTINGFDGYEFIITCKYVADAEYIIVKIEKNTKSNDNNKYEIDSIKIHMNDYMLVHKVLNGKPMSDVLKDSFIF